MILLRRWQLNFSVIGTKITDEFNKRIEALDPVCQKIILEMYANPILQNIDKKK